MTTVWTAPPRQKENAGGSTRAMKHKNDAILIFMMSYLQSNLEYPNASKEAERPKRTL
jgi:hypothetical protein